jgi:hypothetical protein
VVVVIIATSLGFSVGLVDLGFFLLNNSKIHITIINSVLFETS